MPLVPVYRACAKFQLFNLTRKRFDTRDQPHELASPLRRGSTAQGRMRSSRQSSSSNSRPVGRQWLPLSWDRPSLHEMDPTEEHGDDASHHSRRASLVSARSPRHRDTDSSADSADDIFPHDQHPPYRRAPATPSAPHSIHTSPRRVPSNESLPDHDLFDLPRRSTASSLVHAQASDPAVPRQTHHTVRPSHAAPSRSNNLPSSWHHDGSTPF